MGRSEAFYRKIKEGEFASPDFPLQGVNVLYPHGKALLNKLELRAISALSTLGYEEVGLPEVIPSAFIQHLTQGSLFFARNIYREFFLAGSVEMQAALLAREMTHTYKDLPVRFSSINTVHRENDSTTLIKDIEFRSIELNGFFRSDDEARVELTNINNAIAIYLLRLGIPFIRVNQGEMWESPTVFLTLFPFSQTFGSLFWSCIVGTKYVDALNFTFHGKDNLQHKPIQVNGGLTSRILPAYLAHHQDDEGFVLSPDISPYKVLTTSSGVGDEASEILQAIRELNLATKSIQGNLTVARSKFTAMGTPILAQQGRHEIRVTDRATLQSKWVTTDTLRDELVSHLSVSSTNTNLSAGIKTKFLSQPLKSRDSYCSDTVYIIDARNEDCLKLEGLKRVGYSDDKQACYVCKQY